MLKISKIIPSEYIAVKASLINYPDVCLNVQELTLTEQQYKALLELGYDVDWGCMAACGFGTFQTKRHDNKITFMVQDCPCHPGQYFLVLKPTCKKR